MRREGLRIPIEYCRAFDIMGVSGWRQREGYADEANFCAKNAPVNCGRHSSTFVDHRVICQLAFLVLHILAFVERLGILETSVASPASHDCQIFVNALAYLSKSKNIMQSELLSIDFLEPQPSAPRLPPRLAINKARPALSFPPDLFYFHSPGFLSVQTSSPASHSFRLDCLAPRISC